MLWLGAAYTIWTLILKLYIVGSYFKYRVVPCNLNKEQLYIFKKETFYRVEKMFYDTRNTAISIFVWQIQKFCAQRISVSVKLVRSHFIRSKFYTNNAIKCMTDTKSWHTIFQSLLYQLSEIKIPILSKKNIVMTICHSLIVTLSRQIFDNNNDNAVNWSRYLLFGQVVFH